ncbi:MAG TPA: hypothetical protein VEC14_12875, partial [Reyranellaceae bacterium]|nr:hypothetical protein [Reyranellaceae bacterium]
MKSVILRLLSVAFVGATLGACALTEDKVPVDYVPFTNREATSALAGAASVALNVTVTDQRTQYA